VKAVKLWFLLASTYLIARLAFALALTGRLSFSPETWAQVALVPVVETAALSLALFALSRVWRHRP
jgi:hypothetical protein